MTMKSLIYFLIIIGPLTLAGQNLLDQNQIYYEVSLAYWDQESIQKTGNSWAHSIGYNRVIPISQNINLATGLGYNQSYYRTSLIVRVDSSGSLEVGTGGAELEKSRILLHTLFVPLEVQLRSAGERPVHLHLGTRLYRNIGMNSLIDNGTFQIKYMNLESFQPWSWSAVARVGFSNTFFVFEYGPLQLSEVLLPDGEKSSINPFRVGLAIGF